MTLRERAEEIVAATWLKSTHEALLEAIEAAITEAVAEERERHDRHLANMALRPIR